MNNMNNQYGNQYIPPQQYQSPKKKMNPRLKKIILAVIAVLLILGSIPRSYGTEGKGVWGRKAVLWETVSYHVPVVTKDFVGYRDGSTFRFLILNLNTWNNYADESARSEAVIADNG